MNERESSLNQEGEVENLESATQERDRLFLELFGIPYSWAQDLATWDGEIGDRWREVFNYIKHYKEAYETKQKVQSK